MCMYSKWRFPRIATEDIIVYKVYGAKEVLKGEYEYYPPIHCEKKVNIPGMLKAEGNSFSLHNPYKKGKGYIHSTKSKLYIESYYYDRSINDSFDKVVIFKCIIPKGTFYHVANNGYDYCSKKLYVKESVPIYTIYTLWNIFYE